MKKLSLLIMAAGVLCTVPPGAFADSQIIDFSCILRVRPACFDCPIVNVEDDDFTTQGGLGVLDMEEMRLLSLILADPAAPHHDEIHAAFATNAALARTAIGPTVLSYTIPGDTSGETARQPIPNTDPQLYYGADATMAAYILMGEWDLYIETLEGFKATPFGGSEVVVPTSDEGYVILQDLLAMCGDADADGVSNCFEYWAASPYSFEGAIDPEVADAACAWNVWACADVPAKNVRFAYNPSSQRVYTIPSPKLTWAEARDYTVTYPGRIPISASLCTIRNSQEDAFLDPLVDALPEGRTWIGCTDAGRDIGHTAPNPDDWYWLSDPSQSPMTFTRWKYGLPDGVDGAKDCAIMCASINGGFTGGYPSRWFDVSEFAGTPPVPTKYSAILELPDLYPDEDANGAPDAFEDKNGDLVPDGLVNSAQVIDFRCIWEYTFDAFERLGFLMPDVGSIDSTQHGGLGIPDVEEFKLLSLILADPTAPNHDAIRAGFAANVTLVRNAIGGLFVNFTTSPHETGPMARQPIPDTDPQQYYGWNAIMAAYIMLGEWDEYIDAVTTVKRSIFDGPDIVIPTSTEGYVLLPDLLSMCGDADGDGVSNAAEYWAASPHSFANALDPAITEAGAVWNVWACLDEPENNARFWYNTSAQRVYFMPAAPLAWNDALDFTIVYPGRADIPVELCMIRNQQENDFVYFVSRSAILIGTIGSLDYPWIGCTDAGRDIGHAAPNPQDWYWLSDPTQSPMTYTNWIVNNPDGVDGAQDCAVMDTMSGRWRDVSEFTGTPSEPRRRFGIFELDATYPDEDANGAPDAFEDKNGDLVPDGFESPALTADFVATPVYGDMPLNVQFTDLSDGNGATITTWAWNFGDGATSTQQNPTHTYMAQDPATTYTVSLTVTTASATGTRIKYAFITVDYACPFDGQLGSQGALFVEDVMALDSICANLKADLVAVGFNDWADWDIEGLENYPPSAPGDGLLDEIQMALIQYVVCNAHLAVSPQVFAGMTANKALFLADAAALAAEYPGFPDLAPYVDFFAAMIGSSPEMKATVNGIILSMTGNAEGLPNLDNYVIFGSDAKSNPLFAAQGDFDGDGLSNEDELELVVAAGFGLDEFLIAATDPYNFWPGNPDLPAAGAMAAVLLVATVLALATLALRRGRSS